MIVLLTLSLLKADQSPSYHNEYTINLPGKKLHFVRKPQLGYVVSSQDQAAEIKSLEGILKEFQAKDVRRISGRSRRNIRIVNGLLSSSEHEHIVTRLKSHTHVNYISPLFTSNDQPIAIIPEVVVKISHGATAGQLKTFCRTMNFTVKKKLEFSNRDYLLGIPAAEADDVFKAVVALNNAGFIEWAVPNIAFKPRLLGQVIPDDEYFPYQWHLNNTGQSGGIPGADINATSAWEITTGNPNIVVAVLDSGVDNGHPDLNDNIVPGYDFYDDDNSPDPQGDDAHGTACAGLIAANGNNSIGVTGVAWNCKIMPVRIAGQEGFVTEEQIATALRWAANNGADILSNSWGSSTALPAIHSAIQDVTESGGIGRQGKGCIVLASSGNSEETMFYPALYDEVIAVGASDANDVRWPYSSYGTRLDIVAPSGNTNYQGDIWTTDITGLAGINNRDSGIFDYTDKMGGTSGACPIAAAIAALVLSVDPNLNNIDVQDILKTTAKDLGDAGFDNYYGFGRVDARLAVNLTSTLSSETDSEKQWAARYNGPAGADYAQALAVDNSGNVYVTGSSDDFITSSDYTTIKYGPDGNQLWIARYNGSADSADQAQAIAVDSHGNVYVTGWSTDSNGTTDYATVKYDPNGTELWVARYNGPGNNYDVAEAMAMDGFDNVYVTGSIAGLDTSDDYATIKYDTNGNQLWVAAYNGPDNGPDIAKALAIDSSGNVYVTGASYNASGVPDFATVKYDTNGNQLWTRRYNGPGNYYDQAQAIAVDNAGNVLVTGNSFGPGSGNDYATIKYDTQGSQLWLTRYDGPANNEDLPYAIAADNSGNVYVTGESCSSEINTDYATVKYDVNGNQLWVARYDGPANNYDAACALALDNQANVYVTGSSVRYSNSSRSDYLTIKYDTTGNPLWISRYGEKGNYSASAVAADNSQNVYITGYNSFADTGDNYVTVKFNWPNYCTQPLDGDLNGDCKVDYTDLSMFAQQWLTPFDFIDFAPLANNWLDCNLAYGLSCW